MSAILANAILIFIYSFFICIIGYCIGDYRSFQKKMECRSKKTYLEMEISKLKNSLEYEKKENEYLKEENKQLLKKVNELQENLLEEIK